MNNNIILRYLKEKNFDLSSSDLPGITISLDNNELVIKGSKLDLIELANYIVNLALSNNNRDHIHIDDLTLIDKDSKINSLIIEKE